jgi:predicted negative regulator of RcsB-dependent stress response
MRRILVFSVFLIALTISIAQTFAQDAPAKVTIRTGLHDGYTRIVFAWPSVSSYTAQQAKDSLTLNFSKAAAFTISGKPPEALPRINGFSTTGNSAVIRFDQTQSVRHFVIGKRVIVDIKGAAKPAAPAPAAPPSEKPKETLQKAEKPPAPVASPKAPPDAKAVMGPPAPVAKPEPKPEPAKATTAQPGASAPSDAHMINITATQAVGLAVFERFGTLWVVLDQADYPIFPQIAGPQKDKFPPFERVALTGATAFTLKLPVGFKVYGEGGGLIWKIIVTPTLRAADALSFKRDFDQAQKLGGKLIWPTHESRRIVDVPDPEAGDMLKVVTVASSRDFSGREQDFVELSTLTTFIGLAFRPKVDDLEVNQTEKKEIIITRPGGLSLSPETDLTGLQMEPKEEKQDPPPQPGPEKKESANPFVRIFAFDRWLMGGPSALSENQRVLMAAMAGKTDQGKAEDLITLAKMELANGRGPEALGYLDFAGEILKDVVSTPEFIALRGAAEALTGQYDRAFRDFSDKSLEQIAEIKYWRAFSLAELEDWKQAENVMPKDVSILNQYPEGVRIPLGQTMAEIALRAGDTSTADKVLEVIAENEDRLSVANKAALEYLRGESRRQQGDFEGMKTMWGPLTEGNDDLFRAKAGLALTSQLLEKKEITLDQAIDKLEGLRYAWRGDELETAINYKLGRLYMENNQPIKGLTLLRQAASLAPASDLARQITAYMTDGFKKLFLTDKVKDLDPIDALTIYDEFSELIPAGEDGDKVARQLAERLVDADLLPRAENLLQNQINNRLSGMQGAEVALRLASIQILDGKPDKALASLSKAGEFLISVPLAEGTEKRREISLLSARALSDLKKPEEAFAALALLQQDPDILRLRADIAWKAKRWQDAADSLEELVNRQDLDMTKPLEPDQADVILNWAVALYLAENRFAIANLREKYADAMAQTALAKRFEVVTRPRQNSLLADRNTIKSIIDETDIFKGFLDSFKAAKPLPATPAAGQGTPATPTPPKAVSGE